MIIRDTDLNAVLTLGDTSVVGGYMVTDGYDEGAADWDILWASSPNVDGDSEVAARRAHRRLTLPVFIEAETPGGARMLQNALLDAVEVTPWYLDPLGDMSVLWQCNRANVEPVVRFGDGSQRVVTLSVPAAPGRGI